MRRLVTLFALTAFGFGAFTLAEATVPIAWAAPSAAEILAVLQDDAGWTPVSTSKGVAVSTKKVSGVSVPALKGVRVANVDADKLFNLVANIEGQKKVNSMLLVSKVLKTYGTKLDFIQVLDSPIGFSDRYWVNTANNLRNLNGEAGHHRQTWELMPDTSYPEARAEVREAYGDVELTPVNYGSWEVRSLGEGKTEVTYRVISNPGGNIPEGAFSWGSEKTLPDNLNLFIKAAGGS